MDHRFTRNPTTNPADQLGDPPGAILPLGGAVGYKGYGLGMMVEVMGGLLSGQGCASGERVFKSNGVFFTVCDPSFFTDEETYDREIESLIGHVTSSRIDPKIGRNNAAGRTGIPHREKASRRGHSRG